MIETFIPYMHLPNQMPIHFLNENFVDKHLRFITWSLIKSQMPEKLIQRKRQLPMPLQIQWIFYMISVIP